MSGHDEHRTMTLKLIVWRQEGPDKPGRFETYLAREITEHHSFLEMLDVVNHDLIMEGKEPKIITNEEGGRLTPSVVAFDDKGEVLVGQVARRQAMTDFKSSGPDIDSTDCGFDQHGGSLIFMRRITKNNVAVAFNITELRCLATVGFPGYAGAYGRINFSCGYITIAINVGGTRQGCQQMIRKQAMAGSLDRLFGAAAGGQNLNTSRTHHFSDVG